MPNYRRKRQAGATYFFTINIQDRSRTILTDYIQELRQAYTKTQSKYPFIVEAMVVLPDHIHTLWTLPEDDFNYGKRIRLFKTHFTKQLPSALKLTPNKSRQDKQESSIWQRRFWEHTIRNEADFNRHMDYIHFNPVKHGFVSTPADWEFSTFLREVKKGRYAIDWGGGDYEGGFGE